jgi:hypothetical protein
LVQGLGELSELGRGRGVVIVISDMLDRAPDPVAAIERLVARGYDCSLLHVLHRDEREFPFESPAFFASMESKERVFAQPRLVRDAYVKEIARYCRDLESRLSAARAGYALCDADRAPAEILSEFLTQRAALLRVRA